MTVCPVAVILETSPGPRERLPREVGDSLWCNRARGGDDERDWPQRYQATLEKLASGDLVQVVEVVSDLAGREASRGLSAAPIVTRAKRHRKTSAGSLPSADST